MITSMPRGLGGVDRVRDICRRRTMAYGLKTTLKATQSQSPPIRKCGIFRSVAMAAPIRLLALEALAFHV